MKCRIHNSLLGLLLSGVIAGLASGSMTNPGVSASPAPAGAQKIDQLAHQCETPGTVGQTAAGQLRALPPEDLAILKRELRTAGLNSEARAAIKAAIERVSQRAITDARFQRRYRWYLSQTLDAYRQVGDHNPRWDADAETALLLFSREQARPAFDLRNAWCSQGLRLIRIRVAYAAIKALHEGCRDPLIAMILDCNPFWRKRVHPWALRRNIQGDLRALMASRYSAAMKLEFSTAAAYRYEAVSNWKAVAACARENVHLISRVVREPKVPLSFLAPEIASNLAAIVGPADRDHAWSRANAVILRAMDVHHPSPKLRYLNLFFRGYSFVTGAWYIRGNGFANTVSQKASHIYDLRLRSARQYLREAYELIPKQPEVPYEMMNVDLGLGHLRRITKWFQRTMQADPDNHQACNEMLWALHRRWYGSAKLMFRFGQWCVHYGHWNSRIPLLALSSLFAIQAHDNYVWRLRFYNLNYIVVGHQFWRKRSVWKLAKAAMLGFFAHRPTSGHDLGADIFLCIWADKWNEAFHLLKFYGQGPRHPAIERFVQPFYLSHIRPPRFRPLACFAGVNAAHHYFGDTHYSMLRLYREALLRVKHPSSLSPWSVRRRQRDSRYMAWASRVTTGALDANAPKKAIWMHVADRAMHEEAIVLARSPRDRGNARDQMIRAAGKAMNDACRNPLILFFKSYNRIVIMGPDALNSKVACASASRLLKGHFPLTDQFIAGVIAAHIAQEEHLSGVFKASTFLTDALHLLPKFLRDDRIPLGARFKWCRRLWRDVATEKQSPAAASSAFAPSFTAGHTQPILTFLVQAWESEQIGLAMLHGPKLQSIHQLKPRDARKYLSYMHQALVDYHRAWMMNPNCITAIDGAITAQFWAHLRRYARWNIWPAHSTWLIRAFNARPDALTACRIATNFEAMCADPYDGKWYYNDNNLLYELIRAPEYYRRPSSPMNLMLLYGAQTILNYPETNAAPHQLVHESLIHSFHIWRHLHPAMKEYFMYHPFDERVRSLYARVACELHHWNTAERQFQKLGSAARLSVFGNRKMYFKLKIEAADHATN